MIDDEEQRARHLALGAEAPNRVIAAAIEEAAQAAARRGAPDVGADLLANAARLTPVRTSRRAARGCWTPPSCTPTVVTSPTLG